MLVVSTAAAAYSFLPVNIRISKSDEPAVVEARAPAPKPAPAPRRLGGEVRLDSAPAGATIVVNGRNRGTAPLTLKDLPAGTHSIVFEAGGFSISRSIRVRADQPLELVQDMTAGFLTVFSRVPVDVLVDGRPVGSTEEGQLLVAPGTHKVLLTNTRFNFRSEFNVEIKPSEVTSHTVMLPMGAVVVTTDTGAEVWVEGERVGIAPLGPIAVPIGTREVTVKHTTGETRRSVEVVYGRQSELVMSVDAAATPPGTLPVQMPPLSAPPSGRLGVQ